MSAPPLARIKIEDLPPLEQLTEEEMAAIFGAGRARLGIEQLESRELMASNLSATLTAGVLRIEGTDKADSIRIVENLGQISVENKDTGETIFIKRNDIDKPSLDEPLLNIENIIFSPGEKTHIDGNDAKEAAALSVAFSQLTRLEIDPLGGKDEIWIGDEGKGSLSVPLQIIGGKGLDVLHSRGLEFDAGLDQGIKQLHEYNGDVYTITTDDKLYKNGKEMSFGGYELAAAGITLSQIGTGSDADPYRVALSVTGLANVPVFGMVQVTAILDSDGELALKTDVLEGRKILGGLVQLDAPVITLTVEGARLDAHATFFEIGWAKIEGILTFDGNYTLLGVGGVEIGPLKYESVRFTLGSEDVQFKVPVESIGEVSFRASFANGKSFIQGTYPQPVIVGNFTLINITVGIGSDRFSIGADVVPVPGIEGFVGVRFDGEVYFDGRFTLTGKANIKVGPFPLGNATVIISNNPEVTKLKDRTVQLTIDGHVQIASVIDVKLHGTVDGNGNYDLSGEDTFKIAGLELQKTKFSLKKGEGFKFEGNWNYFVFNAKVKGTIENNGHVHFEGDAKTASLAGFNLGKVHAIVDLNSKTGISRMDFSSATNVIVATVNFKGSAVRDAKGNWPEILLTGKAGVSGPLASIVRGEVSFTLDNNSLRFRGVALGGLTVTGTIYSDGSIDVEQSGVGDVVTKFVIEKGELLRKYVEEKGEMIAKSVYEKGELAKEYIYEKGKVVEKTIYENGKKAAKYVYEKGNLARKYLFEKGEVAAKFVYEKGEAVAKFVYEKGELARKYVYEKGEVAAKYVYEKGEVAAKYIYEKGTLARKYLYEKGEVAAKFVYEKGEAVAKFVYEKGELARKYVYEKGEVAAKYVYEKGEIAAKYIYEKGTLARKYLYEKGEVAAKFVYEKGEAVAKFVYEKGELARKYVYEKGEVAAKYVYEKGEVAAKYIYEKGTLARKYLYEKGEATAKYVYEKGELAAKYAYEKGELARKYVYEKGEVVTKFVYENGKVASKFIYENSVLARKFVYENGEVVAKFLYKNGQVAQKFVYKNAQVVGQYVYEKGKVVQSFAYENGKKLENLASKADPRKWFN